MRRKERFEPARNAGSAHHNMNDPEQFLTALQLGDSFFPPVRFAYSSGLETFVSDGLVCRQGRPRRFIDSYLPVSFARGDLIFVRLSLCGRGGQMEEIVRLDGLVHAMKLAKELARRACRWEGSVLNVASVIFPASMAPSLLELLGERRIRGHHSVVFGAVCGDIGISTESSLCTYLYSTISALVSAGVRLVPLGHSDGQLAISGLMPVAARFAKEAMRLGKNDISTFAPGIEIRAMQHEHLFTRLFKS